MNRFLSLLLLCVSIQPAYAQDRPYFHLPDIPGYKTLICDFHLHTVFSDGEVWPTVRVDEAWRDGLDAIAITDHLEYLPHKEDIRTDYNRSWKIAQKYALDKNVLVIPGTEITKSMPPGHFNALFIKDASTIVNDDYLLAIEAAASQGAFVMWNHPGWKAQQPDSTRWWNEHTLLYDKGWLHGIEVVNDGEYYPEALEWAIEKGLSIMGNSDEHSPFRGEFSALSHRPCTIVFATERSLGGIREALFNGRTAAFNGKNIIGDASILRALFLESVKLIQVENQVARYAFRNYSDLHFDLVLTDRVYRDWQKKLSLKPGYECFFSLPAETDIEDIELKVMNFISAPESSLKLNLSAVEKVEQ